MTNTQQTDGEYFMFFCRRSKNHANELAHTTNTVSLE